MSDILIDNLYAVPGSTSPENATDGSGNVYTAWELLDAGAFNVSVPTGYSSGTDFTLSISEATPGESREHKWQVVVYLNGTYTETFTSEVTSSATANTVSSRDITVSTNGTIQSQSIAAGDLLAFQLSRIAASGTEDSNDIKVYSLNLTVTASTEVETISTLSAVSGYTPPSSSNDDDGTYCSLWTLLDYASFNVTVPDDYTSGSSMVLVITEATDGESKKHKWRAVTTLNGSYSTTAQEEFTSSATADTVSTRNITVITSGSISGQTVASGDLLSITLSRQAASADEDPNDIRVYAIQIYFVVGSSTLTATDRLTTIITQVLRKFNDDDQQHISQSQILEWINEAIQEISSHGYWVTSGSLNIVADQTSYDLLTLYPTLMDLESVVWASTSAKLIPVSTWDQYVKLLAVTSSSTSPYCYFLQSNTLFIIPTPSTTTASGATLYYSYCPTALDLTSNTDIPLPKSFDTVLQAYCLMCAYGRDRHAPMAADMFRLNKSLWDKGVARLMAQVHATGYRLRGYR
jgi:hypothetical protein